MISLKKALQIGNYKITEGHKYLWSCYGYNARFLDFVDKDFNIIYDARNQKVYEASITDGNTTYKLFNKKYRDAYYTEANARDVSDDFIELETVNDFISKATAIIMGLDYDKRIELEVNIPNDDLLILLLDAHKKDMTFNDYISKILTEQLNNEH